MSEKFQKYTISDLIIEMVNGYKYDKNIVKDEIVKRLQYCGLDNNTIGHIISFEKAIILKRNLKPNDGLLLDKYYWLDKNVNKIIFSNPDEHVLRPDCAPNDKTLLSGELLCIIDEANILKNRDIVHNSDAINEINDVGRETMDNWVMYEYYNRFENEFRFANNISNDYKGMIIEEKIDKLYNNEMGIVMINRWRDIMPEEAIYIPYE